MDIQRESFYYFSGDQELAGLPTRCRFIKRLENEQGRDSALIECENDIESFVHKELLIVPRNPSRSIFEDGGDELVFLYVFDGNPFLSSTSINLAKEAGTPIDIGAITTSPEVLARWGHPLADS